MRRDIEHLSEKTGGDRRTKDDAFSPIGGEAAVVIGVEMGEEVGDGVIAGVAESVDGETGFGDEFGVRECGRNWRERGMGRVGLVGEGGEGGEEEVGGIKGWGSGHGRGGGGHGRLEMDVKRKALFGILRFSGGSRKQVC